MLSGYFPALVTRTFHDHCIVFIQTKVHAHRMHILLGLLGVKVAELHGNLSQPQVQYTIMIQANCNDLAMYSAHKK